MARDEDAGVSGEIVLNRKDMIATMYKNIYHQIMALAGVGFIATILVLLLVWGVLIILNNQPFKNQKMKNNL